MIESKLTYKELDKQSMRIATYLQSNDLTGKCVILLYPGGLDFIMAFFGCLYAKVIAVPFYHFISNRRISRLMAAVKDSEAKIFLSISSEIKGISSFINNNFPNEGYYWIATDTIKDVKGSDYEKAEILEDSNSR